ncbi:hypothetical protein LTS17_001481 [Exophiala oligosperma]
MNFYLDPSQGGHDTFYPGTAAYYRRKFDEQPVTVYNVRGRMSDFSLDIHGFQYLTHKTAVTNLENESITTVMYDEVADILKKATGATKVHTFSHLNRRDSRDAAERKVSTDPLLESDTSAIDLLTPARFVHIDQSRAGAVEVLRDEGSGGPLDADLVRDCMSGRTRWAIINVWRPLDRPSVTKDPLAVCDSRTVEDSDLVTVRATTPRRPETQYSDVTKGDGFDVLYMRHKSPQHQHHHHRQQQQQQWYFLDAQSPDEVLLIKCFDSQPQSRHGGRSSSVRTPHTAFVDPRYSGSPEWDEKVRNSIEIRSLVFWENN